MSTSHSIHYGFDCDSQSRLECASAVHSHNNVHTALAFAAIAFAVAARTYSAHNTHCTRTRSLESPGLPQSQSSAPIQMLLLYYLSSVPKSHLKSSQFQSSPSLVKRPQQHSLHS